MSTASNERTAIVATGIMKRLAAESDWWNATLNRVVQRLDRPERVSGLILTAIEAGENEGIDDGS